MPAMTGPEARVVFAQAFGPDLPIDDVERRKARLLEQTHG